MGLSYKLSLDRESLSYLISGFLESEPSQDLFLGHRVYSPKQLESKENIQILIASKKYSETISIQLMKAGFKKEQILLPTTPRYQLNAYDFITNNQAINKILIYPPIASAHQALHLFKKINRQEKALTEKQNIIFHVPHTGTEEVIEYLKKHSNSKIKTFKASNYNDVIEKITLNKQDRIVLWSANHFKDIHEQEHSIIRLIDLSILDRFNNLIKATHANNIQLKNKERVSRLKTKRKIKVLFLINQIALWRLTNVVKKMLLDDLFDPLIMITPFTYYGEERMYNDLSRCYKFFQEKELPFITSFNSIKRKWTTLKEINPDIIIISDPHKTTLDEYYENAYMNYLTCYVPYTFDAATNFNTDEAYNKPLHNFCWSILSTCEFSKNRAKTFAKNKGTNTVLTGSFTCEELAKENYTLISPWKTQSKNKIKIIYAPHQSIETDATLNISTFLTAGLKILELAVQYQDEIQWAFKPHPFLKEKLYRHPDWGKNLTDAYYDFWTKNTFTQFEDGSYVELFKTSDALIHDCGSFLFEYLVTKKPCAFLELNSEKQLLSINEFGLKSLNCHTRIKNLNAIETFLDKLVNDSIGPNIEYINMLNTEIIPRYYNDSPSDIFISHLKNAICPPAK